MAAAAELKIRTTHDGTQAEASLNRLNEAVKKLKGHFSGQATTFALSFFSVEMVKKFAAAIDNAADKVSKLIDKVREGKKDLNDMIRESGISEQGVSVANEYTKFKTSVGIKTDSILNEVLRALVLSVGSSGLGAAIMGDPRNVQARALFASALSPDIARQLLEGDVQAAIDARNAEADRQATIKWIQDQELNATPPADRKTPEAREEREVDRAMTRYFGALQQVGAYSNVPDRWIAIGQEQLRVLRSIDTRLESSPIAQAATAPSIFPN